jgi:methyl-accepting chemotaxis protein
VSSPAKNKTFISIRTRQNLAYALLAGLVAATGATGLWATNLVGKEASRIGVELVHHVDAASDVKFEITAAHLLLQRITSGSSREDPKQVLDVLDNAQWYANAILSGGAKGADVYLPTSSPDLRAKYTAIIATIEEYRKVAKQRIELNKFSNATGSEIELEFDAQYRKSLAAIDALSKALRSSTSGTPLNELLALQAARFELADGHLDLEELLTGDPTLSMAKVEENFSVARKKLSDAAFGSSTSLVTDALAELDELVRLAQARHAMFTTEKSGAGSVDSRLNSLHQKLTGVSNDAFDMMNADVTTALEKSRATEQFGLYAILGMLLFALMCAALLSRFSSRRVSDRIATLSGQMNTLAEYKMETEVSYANDPDEIGQMARSLEIFRQAMIARGQLELQAIAEKALTERRNRELESAFQQDLSVIIESASSGDFSRRIDTSNKEGLSQRIGDGMNRLVGTVDGALKGIIDVIAGLARGDLTRRVEGEFKGSFKQLKDDTNTMAEKFRSIARRIAGSTREVQGATGEIAAGVADLSARTEHQASSLEETSASMEELANTVRQNADHAQQVNKLAAAARDAALGGGRIATQAVSAMSRIEDSSRQIADIVGLIQDIAFQTNLLALNAAVEAARAGEAGKGFAVVANEVRALAQRAGQASKDIKSLIITSDNNVRDGVNLVRQAGTSLEDIVTSVKKVAGLVSDIAGATVEQSSGIEQVSRAVTGMDQMTQQNAALVEETNAALQSAQSQVEELRKMVSFFQTGEDTEREPAARTKSQAEPPNQVRQQFQQLAQRMAATRTTAAPAFVHDEWKEF